MELRSAAKIGCGVCANGANPIGNNWLGSAQGKSRGLLFSVGQRSVWNSEHSPQCQAEGYN